MVRSASVAHDLDPASGLGQFGEWCAASWGCSHMLTMYTTTWCGFCARLKAQLQREGIEYAEVDIERDESAAELVMSVNAGNQTVPTLVFPDGTALTNPSVAEVKAQLAA
jgi:mycoredoxin